MWQVFAGQALQSAGNIVGGLLQGKQDNYHPEVWRNDAYKNYMKQIQGVTDAAKKYGFHPLALLGSGMQGGGFATPVNSGNQFGVGDAVGEALRGFGSSMENLYASDMDRMQRDEERGYYERDRALDILRSKEITPEVRLQRENMQLQNELLRSDIATSRTRLAEARAGAIGGSSSRVLVGPGGLTMAPVGSPSQHWEDEYGELGDLVGGGGRMIDDLTSGRIVSEPLPGLGYLERAWHDWLKSKGLWGILRRPGPVAPAPDYDVPMW